MLLDRTAATVSAGASKGCKFSEKVLYNLPCSPCPEVQGSKRREHYQKLLILEGGLSPGNTELLTSNTCHLSTLFSCHYSLGATSMQQHATLAGSCALGCDTFQQSFISAGALRSALSGMPGQKVFVGSLSQGITQDQLSLEKTLAIFLTPPLPCILGGCMRSPGSVGIRHAYPKCCCNMLDSI